MDHVRPLQDHFKELNEDFHATKWDGKTGNWWQDENIDQPTVD